MTKQTVVLIASPQGGSGKSTIAVNMAIHCAKKDMKVLLIDLAGYGSLPPMLKVPIKGKGMSTLITAMEQSEYEFQLDRFIDYFREAVVPYSETSQLHLLLGSTPLKMEKLTLSNTNQLIEAAKRENYQLIIVDTSSELCERNIACLEQADLILIPTLQDIAAGWKLLQFRDILENLNIPRDRAGIVVNRCSKYAGFNNLEFQVEIGYELLGEIDDMPNKIQRFANIGVPAVNAGKSKASAPFRTLSSAVLKKVGYI